jgi:hypothetical protein
MLGSAQGFHKQLAERSLTSASFVRARVAPAVHLRNPNTPNLMFASNLYYCRPHCYCSLDSGPNGHGLSKLRLSELYVRATICT